MVAEGETIQGDCHTMYDFNVCFLKDPRDAYVQLSQKHPQHC